MTLVLPEGFTRGPLQGLNVIGEVTEALHRYILDGWNLDTPRPRLEEDISFVPKDKEEVIYLYMYRAAHNNALFNSKRWRPARVTLTDDEGNPEVYWERAPLYLELHYLIGVHAKFRSDAERLLGWLLLRLHEATHLLYRPRRYLLPDGREVNSEGRSWDLQDIEDDVVMEKVALSLVDDMTIGDAINFFTIHEAPYRPFLTYQARCSMEGALIAGELTTIQAPRADSNERKSSPDEPKSRPNGRMGSEAPEPSEERHNPGPKRSGKPERYDREEEEEG